MNQEELKEKYPLAYWKGRHIDMQHLYNAHPTDDFRLAVVYAIRKIKFLERKARLFNVQA